MRYIFAIAGGSCSGKTLVTKEVIKQIEHTFNSSDDNITEIHQDSYYKGGNSETNFDEPKSIDWELFEKQVKELCNGLPIDSPIYSFETHQRLEKTKKVYPSKVIIIEGTMILNSDEIRKLADVIIFVSAFKELMYERRLERDVKERGRSRDDIKKRYFAHVRPGFTQYVEPTQQFADIILHNNSDDYKFVGLELLLAYIEKILNK